VQASKIPPSIQKRYQFLSGKKDLFLIFFEFMKNHPETFTLGYPLFSQFNI